MEKLVKIGNSIVNPVGPYSTGIISNGFLFVSGQIGLDPVNGILVSGGIETETHQILTNLDRILEVIDLDSSNVVMVSIFLLDMSDYQKVNSIYSGWVNKDLSPARQTIAVRELPLNAKIEISLTAEIKDRQN